MSDFRKQIDERKAEAEARDAEREQTRQANLKRDEEQKRNIQEALLKVVRPVLEEAEKDLKAEGPVKLTVVVNQPPQKDAITLTFTKGREYILRFYGNSDLTSSFIEWIIETPVDRPQTNYQKLRENTDKAVREVVSKFIDAIFKH